MKAFRFLRPRDGAEAAAALVGAKATVLKAGGSDLLDRMKERIDEPDTVVGLVDARGLGGVRLDPDGSIHVGARVTLAELAASELCRQFLPTLAEAAGSAASPQIRNVATIAGNLAQHTRCGYYRHASFPCRKRGGESCPVQVEGGVQEHAGVFAGACVSGHPSSVAPVLGCLDVEVLVRRGERAETHAFEALWRKDPASAPSDLALGSDALIAGLRVPARDVKQHVGFAEVRQKAAFDWALVTCAVRYETDAEGRIRQARVWFGSVAPTPHRAGEAEAALVGKACDDVVARIAGEAAFARAAPLPGAAYKVHLAKVALVRALAAARGRSG